MDPKMVIPQLAALLYYGSAEYEKGVSFESLPEEKQSPYLAQAVTALAAIDKLNLRVLPKPAISEAEAEKLLHDKFEACVRDFFAGIRVWKKGAIPQEELVARIWQVWKS